MPPALSDDDSDVEVVMPVRMARKADFDEISDSGRIKPLPGADEDDEVEDEDEDNGDEDEEELDEDEFIVEAIKKHMIDAQDGTLKFQVKWEGWDAKADLTWEPEENLAESATEVLEDYFARIGGREKIFEESAAAAKTKKRGRAPSSAPAVKRSRKGHPAETTPPVSAKAWKPPAGSWEDDIEAIDACEEDKDGALVVYLVWKNGKKTKHPTNVVYKKCPQKMLQFYERHVKIIKSESK